MNRHRRELSPEAIRRLTVDTEPWLSCDDCFHLVDQYVQQLVGSPGNDMPAMRAHLAGCSACSEEAQSLLLLAADDTGTDPETALRRLPGP